MNEIGEKYLSIGTIVLLKNATKSVMITGFASMSPETGEQIFDYSGCPYPEGFLNYNEVCVFNHDQIDKIIFQGYSDEQDEQFKKLLVEQLELIAKEKESKE
ncbi:MAG: DUF4176 domain-containing protein [Bacilli bacterium]|nr:DUF4176 domain-containing protein [Bacilli bacterium]